MHKQNYAVIGQWGDNAQVTCHNITASSPEEAIATAAKQARRRRETDRIILCAIACPDDADYAPASEQGYSASVRDL